MRILCLLPFLPYPLHRGTNQRVFHLLKGLSEEHTLTGLVMVHRQGVMHHENPDEALQHLAPLFESLTPVSVQLNDWQPLWQRWWKSRPATLEHWRIPEFAQQVDHALNTQHYDAIYCEDLCMAQYLLKYLKHAEGKISSIPVIIDRNRVDAAYHEEKAPYLPFYQRLSHQENLSKMKHMEKRMLQAFPHQVVCSTEDLQYLQQLSEADQVRVIGNGFDAKTFQPVHKVRSQTPVLCFTGAMDYPPNVDAMHWFFKAIYPRLQRQWKSFKVQVVGIRPLPEIQAYAELPGVEVTGKVPDIAPYYAQCDIYIAPVRIGGGTRLKLIEAMACKAPLVTTSTAAQGLGLSEKEAWFAEDAEAFTAAIVQAWENPDEARERAERAHAYVHEHLTWQTLGAQLAQRVASCAASAASTRGRTVSR